MNIDILDKYLEPFIILTSDLQQINTKVENGMITSDNIVSEIQKLIEKYNPDGKYIWNVV